jgi:hypothetical protein
MQTRRARFVHGLAVAGALVMIAEVPMACARGSSESDLLASGAGGAGNGGAGQVGSSRAATTGSFPTATTASVGSGGSATTGEFPAASTGNTGGSSTTGFPASSTAVTVATTGPATVASTSATTGTGGPSSLCDIGDCGECGCCAENLLCASQAEDCEFDPDCSTILCCVVGCAPNDDACVQDCYNSDPAGQSLFEALNNCLACACVESCQIPAGDCP